MRRNEGKKQQKNKEEKIGEQTLQPYLPIGACLENWIGSTPIMPNANLRALRSAAKKDVIYMNEDQNRQNIEISKAGDQQPDKSQVSDKESKIEAMKNWLKRFGDKIKGTFNKEEYGHLIILLGQRKTGKSETVKTLCKQTSGPKYVVKFNEELIPTKIPKDDKKDWKKIPNVTIIETTAQLKNQGSGLLIIEDYPALSTKAKRSLYNKIKDSRHQGYQANYIIIAHDYSVIKGKIYNQANAILIYKDAAIKPNHLDPKVGGLKQGWAIKRAKDEIQKFQYIFISFDHKRWHNQVHLDSRNTKVLKQAIKGKLKSKHLQDISYPKKSNTTSKTQTKTKKSDIIKMLKQGKDYTEIKKKKKTSLDTIYKIKSQERRKYREKKGWPKNIPELQYPKWLQDKRG